MYGDFIDEVQELRAENARLQERGKEQERQLEVRLQDEFQFARMIELRLIRECDGYKVREAALLAQGEALRRLVATHDALADDLCSVCDLGSSGEDCHCVEKINDVTAAWTGARAVIK